MNGWRALHLFAFGFTGIFAVAYWFLRWLYGEETVRRLISSLLGEDDDDLE